MYEGINLQLYELNLRATLCLIVQLKWTEYS